MSTLSAEHAVMLQTALETDFIPHLPVLLNLTKPPEDQKKKNQSRAFSAFAVHHICGAPKVDAAKAVVDDFDDYGLDAVYYHASTETLYLVQSKLKAAAEFKEDEALAFCQGVRKLIHLDLAPFNQHVQKRLIDIEDAMSNCSRITLVVAHTGSGISAHARKTLNDLLADEDHGEVRLQAPIIEYDADRVVADLRGGKAYPRVDADLTIQKCGSVTEPRLTFFGLVKLQDLTQLHDKHDKALYEKNIRTFLGGKTEVNRAIQETLRTAPQDFMYLNNGVTALCQRIEPKQPAGKGRRLKLTGVSVINGAQTIASSAKFVASGGGDISSARVSLTLIQANAEDGFGKSITRARNHQNIVHFSNFAALDEEQERLRRDLAYLGIHYAYKEEAPEDITDPCRIRIEEAAHALALFQKDPRYAIWLKNTPGDLLNTESVQYKALFCPTLKACELANAVLFSRYVRKQLSTQERASKYTERLAYKYGGHALAWVLAKRVSDEAKNPKLFDADLVKAGLSIPFDKLRQTHWDNIRTVASRTSKGPLALFRSQTETIPLMQEIAIEHYGLTADPAIPHKKAEQKFGQPYPVELFYYITKRAPQIGGLA